MSLQPASNGNYAAINGLKLYYEIHGSGFPLVLIHGGGSTIDSNFGSVLPEISKTNQVIAVELQAHGRTADIDRPMTFEQDADDMAALLDVLGIEKAHILGFSNGGTTAIQFAIRHPERAGKLVLASATTKREGMISGFFEGMQHASLDNMPQPLKDAFLKVNPDPNGLKAMFHRDVTRMRGFEDIPDEDVSRIQSPVLIISGQNDVVRAEHSLELSRLIPNAALAILPGGHSDYIGEICSPSPDSVIPLLTIAMINEFLVRH